MNFMNNEEGPKFSWFDKFCIKLASADEATLRLCPPHDLAHVRATAELLIATMCYQTAIFSVAGERLFAPPGQFRPEIVLAAALLSLFLALIDSYCVIGSQWQLAGIEQIKRGGLDISGGWAARLKANIYLALRIALSIALAQVTAVFVSMAIFHADISARTQSLYQRANAPLVTDATALVDGNVRRATDAVAAESAQVNALATQVTDLRQSEVDPSANAQTQQAGQEVAQALAQKAKADDAVRAAQLFANNELGGIKGADDNSGLAGNGPRHLAALAQVKDTKAYAEQSARAVAGARARLDALRKQAVSASGATKQQSDAELPGFENSLTAENAKLSALKTQLASLVRDRDDAIQSAVEHAPTYVAPGDGLLAKISALEYVAHADPKTAIVIALIDVISFGLELAAVLATVTSFVPTTLSALMARDAYLRCLNIADEIARAIDLSSKMADIQFPPRDKPSESRLGDLGSILGPNPAGSGDAPQQPPKRPRGRPRKHPLN